MYTCSCIMRYTTKYFCKIKIIFTIDKFQTLHSLQLWEKNPGGKKNLFYFSPKYSPYLLNGPYIIY